MANLTQVSANKIFDGQQKVYSHDSKTLGCVMKFGIYLPAQSSTKKVPVIYWLSGLTCTEQNFITKAGAQHFASQYGVALVAPDTSPRNLNIPGDSDSYDIGTGAGFYINATNEPWKTNYKMYDYVTKELVELINTNFPIDPLRKSIMGHSMGGHGALITALKNPGQYKAVSAFAPICNPCEGPWGKKIFNNYLGPRETSGWEQWDATELVGSFSDENMPIYIEQGADDEFLHQKQLLPENFLKAAPTGLKVKYECREGYDHSYYFIATFIGDHIKKHMEVL